jgi:hypothetical protein
VSWHTAHAGFIDVAADAGIDIEVAKTGAEPDTQPRSQDQADQPPQAEPEPVTQAEPEPVTQAEPEPVTQAEPEPVTQAEPRHTSRPASRSTALPFVHALGIDEHRRGKARFHVVQLATKMVDDVRRRVTYERYGRRGRASDPEYTVKNLLRRAQEKLSKPARHKLLCALADLGDAGRQIGAAWRVKELVRDLVKLSPNRTGITPSRNDVGDALAAVFEFAATVGESVPEIQTLAETISTWRAEIARAVLTGHSNAAAEGVNRLVKLVYRGAFGLTNVANQQRRARYAATRSTRPHWLHKVTSAAHVG